LNQLAGRFADHHAGDGVAIQTSRNCQDAKGIDAHSGKFNPDGLP